MNTTPPAASSHATRRSVLAWTGAGLATALTGAWPGAARAADSGYSGVIPADPGSPDTSLSRERFLPLLGSQFQFHPASANFLAAAPVRCRLIEVSPHQVTGTEHPLRFVSFSLLFHCPEIPAEGGIQRLQHPALPELELFLAPVGKPAADGSGLLEAVCSQRAINTGTAV